MTMASMQLTRASLFNISRAFPRSRAPPCFAVGGRRVSRVCFASPVSRSAGRGMVAKAGDSSYESIDDKARGAMKDAGEYGQAVKDKFMEGGDKAGKKADEGARQVSDAAGDVRDRAQDYADDTMEKAKDAGETLKEKTKEGTEKAKDMSQKFNETVKDKAQEVSEKTQETVKEAWESAKDTAQRVTDAVAGDDKK